MRQGRLVPFPTLRERPKKAAALQRRFACALSARRLSPRLVRALQLLYAIACILVVIVSLAAIAGLP